MMYQGIYQEAKVLQREAFNFEFQLERIAQLVGEEVDENQTFEIQLGLVEHEPVISPIYEGIEISTGQFKVPSYLANQAG